MIPRRTVILVACLAAVLGVVAGTGGVSSTAADREIQVKVTGDDAAYVGFEQSTERINGTTNLTVTVENRFPSGVTLETVDVTVDGETVHLGPLDSGEAGSVTFDDVDCENSVEVAASGDDLSVRLDREECG